MTGKALSWLVGAIVSVLVIVVVLLNITEKVSEGHVAVVYTPSEGAKRVLDPGWHWVGLLDKTYEFSVRAEVIDTSVEVNTSDGKKITVPVTYNMTVDADKKSVLKLFKSYGPRGEKYYSETVIQQQLRKISKETIAKYSTLDIFTTKLTNAGNEIGDQLAKKMAPKGFVIEDLALLAPKIDKNTAATIDAQIQAQQANELKKLEKENDKIDQERAQQQADADKKRRQTEADTKAYEIMKAAEAEAEANRKISESLTDKVLKKMELEARQKHGWVTIQGQNTVITEEKK